MDSFADRGKDEITAPIFTADTAADSGMRWSDFRTRPAYANIRNT